MTDNTVNNFSERLAGSGKPCNCQGRESAERPVNIDLSAMSAMSGEKLPLGGREVSRGPGKRQERKWSVAASERQSASVPRGKKNRSHRHPSEAIRCYPNLTLFLAADLCLRDPDQIGPKTFLAGEMPLPTRRTIAKRPPGVRRRRVRG